MRTLWRHLLPRICKLPREIRHTRATILHMYCMTHRLYSVVERETTTNANVNDWRKLVYLFLHSHKHIHSLTGALCLRSVRSRDERAVWLYTEYGLFFHNLTATVATLTHSHTHARTYECRTGLQTCVAKCAQLSTAFLFLHFVFIAKHQLFLLFASW